MNNEPKKNNIRLENAQVFSILMRIHTWLVKKLLPKNYFFSYEMM